MATINYYIDKILIRCGLNSISNHKYIAKDGFQLFEYIMFLNDKDIGNL